MPKAPRMALESTVTTPDLLGQLRARVRRGRILMSPAQLAGYDTDGLGFKSFRPDAVVIPADADELKEFLRDAPSLGFPVCMRGAGTSLSGGPVAAQGGIVVHTSQLRAIRHISSDGLWCEAECGVTLRQLEDALRPYGLFYPPDPSSGPVCTLGGNVAMNAGGAHCFRYGVTSNYVLGVEAVMLDGSVHRFGGPYGGRGAWRYDWKRLMVGSEGTLAAFTRFWLRLLPNPEKVWTFRATYPDLISAERAIHALVAHPAAPVAIELMDPRCVAMVENSPMAVGLPQNNFMLLTEIDGPEKLVDARVDSIATLLRDAGSKDVLYSDESTQRQKLWKARKASGGLMGQISSDLIVQDAVIPKRALAETLQLIYSEADAIGIPVVNVFHAGDGNLHPNFLFDARIPEQLHQVEALSCKLMRHVVEVGGTLSGEHGIGNDKTAYMPWVFGADALKLQLAIPRVFNPHHQFNPLKVFDSRCFHSGPSRRSPGANAGIPASSPKPDVGRVNEVAVSDDAPLSRPFTPFFDSIDGVICVPADLNGKTLRERCAESGFRFPLLLDDQASLREQLMASTHAPASSRFGPFCDNVLGMNWRLSDGRSVRLGERVVKTTTGYDLFRFLLGTGGEFGIATDLVLRLRPMVGTTTTWMLLGEPSALQAIASAIVHSCWLQWFDSVDMLVDADPEVWKLRLVWQGPEGERSETESYIHSLVQRLPVDDIGSTINEDAALDGCPDLVIKSNCQDVLDWARTMVEQTAMRCVASVHHGVIHGYRSPHSTSLDGWHRFMEHEEGRLTDQGGDWSSRHLQPRSMGAIESQWIETLREGFSHP